MSDKATSPKIEIKSRKQKEEIRIEYQGLHSDDSTLIVTEILILTIIPTQFIKYSIGSLDIAVTADMFTEVNARNCTWSAGLYS